MNKKIKYLILNVFILTGICFMAWGIQAQAVNVQINNSNEMLSAIAYKDAYYEMVGESRINGEQGSDGVDLRTGNLNLQRNDLSLPGVGGFDLELSRYYSSNESNMGYGH